MGGLVNFYLFFYVSTEFFLWKIFYNKTNYSLVTLNGIVFTLNDTPMSQLGIRAFICKQEFTKFQS